MFNFREFKEYLNVRIKYGFGYNDIALQPIMILPDASDQMSCVFTL